MNSDKSKIYVVGNWKMNPLGLKEAETIFEKIENEVYKINSEKVETVVCMPYLFLSDFDSEGKVKLGAQDVFWEKQGAYTGEISAEMLYGVGAKYAIVGHSERRYYLGETNEMVNLKVRGCLAGKIRPVLCVGETLDEKKKGDAGEVIITQIEKALEGVFEAEIFNKLLIAYEPVWAIGSGETPTTDEIMSTGLLIKKVLSKIYGNREIAEEIPILYGGSVRGDNSFDLVDKTGLRGLLIGGASLRADEFVEIIKKFE